MRTPESLLRIPGLIIVSLLLIVSYANPSSAAFAKKVTGSYLLTQDDGFLQILTLTRRGNALSQNNGQFIGQHHFGDQQGAWQKTDRKHRKLVIKTLDFTFDTEFTGFGRSTFEVVFDEGFDTLVGTVLVEIFGPDQDPLDPNATPIVAFGPTAFTGERIKAD